MNKIKKVPNLRFKEFFEEWEIKKISQILKAVSSKVKIEENELYKQIGIRSHGKGIFYKEPVIGRVLGNKRVFWIKENAFIVNIVFAWEQAIAKTTKNELGMVASHRFPMYQPLHNLCNIDYILYFFLTKKGKFLLELASPGGAGRNKTLGQSEFQKLKFTIPSIQEQEKIANFLSKMENRIEKLTRKKQLLEKYKKGVMQKIFNQEIRFKNDNGEDYSDWEIKKLGEIATIHRGADLSKSDLVENGKNKCIHYGELFTLYNEVIKKVFSSTNKDNGVKSKNGDILMPSSDVTPQGLAKASAILEKDIILGGDINIVRPCDLICSIFLSYQLNFFSYAIIRLVTGTTVKHIYSKDLKTLSIRMPKSKEEQTKIANFLTEIDKKINLTEKQLNGTKQYKKGLLQQMFI